MKDIDTIDHFISLRAARFTYKEISEEIDISRPTLVKWNKKYRDTIEQVEKYRFMQIFSQNIVNNEITIVRNSYTLRKYDKLDDKTAWSEKVASKAEARLTKIFLNKLESINLTFSKTEKIKTVKFNFKERYIDKYDYYDDEEYEEY